MQEVCRLDGGHVREQGLMFNSTKSIARIEVEDLVTVEEELRVGEGCPIPGFPNSVACTKPHGNGRGASSYHPKSLEWELT